ncbi:hypothetical protein [Xanthomonas oryzae]|uniref:hypothetical protein n=2 Tax=Xanthomonas oryzae TaxID=347 RepID=UPI00117DE735|nr:hypothetical protein [Xanthomonas oryzae]UNW43072.1 hypothetical protein H4J00_02825 [Xanthomonas oryzae pv. oryzicola]
MHMPVINKKKYTKPISAHKKTKSKLESPLPSKKFFNIFKNKNECPTQITPWMLNKKIIENLLNLNKKDIGIKIKDMADTIKPENKNKNSQPNPPTVIFNKPHGALN